MQKKRLEDDDIHVPELGFFEYVLSPSFKIFDFDPEAYEGPPVTRLDAVLDGSGAEQLKAAYGALCSAKYPSSDCECRSFKVTSFNLSGWYVIHAAGSQAFIQALAAKAEALGGRRITN